MVPGGAGPSASTASAVPQLPFVEIGPGRRAFARLSGPILAEGRRVGRVCGRPVGPSRSLSESAMGQVGAEVAQGRAVAQQRDPGLAGIVVPVDGEVPVQADRPGDHGGQRGGPGRPEMPSAPDLVDHIDHRPVVAGLRGVRRSSQPLAGAVLGLRGSRDGAGRCAASVMPRAYSGASGWATGRSPGEASSTRCPGGAAPGRGGCPLRCPRGRAAPDGVRAVSDSRSGTRTVSDSVSNSVNDSETVPERQ